MPGRPSRRRSTKSSRSGEDRRGETDDDDQGKASTRVDSSEWNSYSKTSPSRRFPIFCARGLAIGELLESDADPRAVGEPEHVEVSQIPPREGGVDRLGELPEDVLRRDKGVAARRRLILVGASGDQLDPDDVPILARLRRGTRASGP